VAEHLATAYGARANEVAGIAAEAPPLSTRIDPELPFIWAEVVYAGRHDRARTLVDVLARRTTVFRDARDQGLGGAPRAAELLSQELGWHTGQATQQVAAYREAVERSRRWRTEIGGTDSPSLKGR
jgi:glycerol-3-phosphate dehydrogenase